MISKKILLGVFIVGSLSLLTHTVYAVPGDKTGGPLLDACGLDSICNLGQCDSDPDCPQGLPEENDPPPPVSTPPGNEKSLPPITGRSAIIIDRSNGEVIGVKQPDARRAMASTTKIMTALLAIEAIRAGTTSKSRIVTIRCQSDFEVDWNYKFRKKEKKNDRKDTDTGAGLLNGDTISLEDLLYLMMLRSYNDAAVSVGCHIAGSRKVFLRSMNERADALGLTNTNYVSISGRDPEDYLAGCEGNDLKNPRCAHYASARDLATLTKKALTYSLFSRIVSTQSYQTTTWVRSYLPPHKNVIENPIEGSINETITNTNGLLDQSGGNFMQGANGVKTGTSNQAGPCLVFAAKRRGRDIIGVTLFAGSIEKATRYQDARDMIDWATAFVLSDTPRPPVKNNGMTIKPRF